MNAPILNYPIDVSLAENSYLVVLRKEAYSVPHDIRRIRVASGNVWVTIGTQDVFLAVGQDLAIKAGHEPVILSALKRGPAIVELLNA